MRFGVFYELQMPKPWDAGSEHRIVHEALEQVALADRLGFDYAWCVEHHFLEEYSHSPSPESFLAAASQRTKQIRLGHGIMQLTTNHPARCAERVASLDLLSNGRCEFGMGESASITELEPFGVDMENKREIFEEAVWRGSSSIAATIRPWSAICASSRAAAAGRISPRRGSSPRGVTTAFVSLATRTAWTCVLPRTSGCRR